MINHDAAGNTIVDWDGYQFYYDYENRMIRIKDSQNYLVAIFEYDALGRRMMKTTYMNTQYYYYNADWQVLAEDDGAFIKNQYIYGNYIDEPLLMDDGTDDYYYAHNHLFSTVALMDDTGAVIERYEYNAYGTVTVYTDDGGDGDWYDGDETVAGCSAVGNSYTFTGRRLDVFNSGALLLMYYRTRTYDTCTGRFMQQDPLHYVDGMSLYQYVISNPLFFGDPLGMMANRPCTIEECEWRLTNRRKFAYKKYGDWSDPRWSDWHRIAPARLLSAIPKAQLIVIIEITLGVIAPDTADAINDFINQNISKLDVYLATKYQRRGIYYYYYIQEKQYCRLVDKPTGLPVTDWEATSNTRWVGPALDDIKTQEKAQSFAKTTNGDPVAMGDPSYRIY